jgi:hypothetical protein
MTATSSALPNIFECVKVTCKCLSDREERMVQFWNMQHITKHHRPCATAQPHLSHTHGLRMCSHFGKVHCQSTVTQPTKSCMHPQYARFLTQATAAHDTLLSTVDTRNGDGQIALKLIDTEFEAALRHCLIIPKHPPGVPNVRCFCDCP